MLIKILENPTEQSSGVVTDFNFNTVISFDIIISTNLIFSESIVLLSKPMMMMREIKTSKNNWKETALVRVNIIVEKSVSFFFRTEQVNKNEQVVEKDNRD